MSPSALVYVEKTPSLLVLFGRGSGPMADIAAVGRFGESHG